MKRLPLVLEVTNTPMCTACGGNCCKNGPGIAHPDEWGAPDTRVMFERIGLAMAEQRWTMDVAFVRGYPVLYLRPAAKGLEHVRLDTRRENKECTFLTPRGCEHPFDQRPKGCRELVPNKGHGCYRPGIDDAMDIQEHDAAPWAPYWDLMKHLLSLFGVPVAVYAAFRDP